MHRYPESVPSPDDDPSAELLDLRSIALLLDVDGTILDTALTPGGVEVPASLRASLEILYAKSGGALALVSGRLISNLDALFAPLRLPAIGGHGAEMRLPGESAPNPRYGFAIGTAVRNLVTAAMTDPRLLLEDKGSSLAVHYRLAPELGPMLAARIAAIASHARVAAQKLEVMHGKAVIEIKSARFNKGEAVRDLMKISPFSRRRPIFVGDDTTDESVFAVLPELGGLGFSVERSMPGASATFASPDAVRRWLARLGAGGANVSP